MKLERTFAERLPELSVPHRTLAPEAPEIVALDEGLARELGLDPDELHAPAGVRFLLGNDAPDDRPPVAQAYAGHQFGGYIPRLGDGRAALIGELRDPAGGLRDLHLKGSGPTPFARADGYATLPAMLREFAVSRAMHELGIPTTRGLAVIGTGRRVPRDGELLPGAVLVRVAASHLRVGTLQYARALDAAPGGRGILRRVADYAVERHDPESARLAAEPDGERYASFLGAVAERQARLVARWQLVGFVHGVMNTDNTTLSGETIDYGPCAFIDAYDPGAVFSSIDHGGRYAYGNQPAVAQWNLARLADALLPLLGWEPDRAADRAGGGDADAGLEAATAQALAALDRFGPAFDAEWRTGMRAKLGIAAADDRLDRIAGDLLDRIAGDLLEELRRFRIDFSGAFADLVDAAAGDDAAFRARYPEGRGPGEWFARWWALGPDPEPMRAANPRAIPRNHLVDAALEAAGAGDLAPFERLMAAVSSPYARRPEFADYAAAGPERRHVTYCGT